MYEHKGSTLSADSGDLYKDDLGREFFEAHGNIVINQPSGTTIYGTHLHYDAESQQAVLTRNVRMVDGETTLTTNYLTYNMRSQRGTYRNGGRIEGKGDTITSQSAYYFETSKDAYFNNKVVVRSPNVIIYTDTMQYNTMYRDAFFFGPTNIKGRKGENLYTEKGTYNTAFGIAKFNKNNLYTEGSRFLKGDSLFYDRNKGLGEAFRNVVFVDTLDKFYSEGGYGKYIESDQSILMTDKPLVKYVIQNDSSNSKVDTTNTDSLKTDKSLSKKEIKKLEREKEKELKEKQKQQNEQELKAVTDTTENKPLVPSKQAPQVDTAYMTADTLYSRVIFVRDYKPLDLKLDRNGGQIEETTEVDYGDLDDSTSFDNADSLSLKLDSNKIAEKSQQINSKKIEGAKKVIAPKKAPEKTKAADSLNIELTTKADSVLRKKAEMPTGNEHDELITDALKSAQTADTLLKDSTQLFADTARTRIVRANYNVRVFKSDLQAVADSVYYGMVDSMFRFMGKPMIWSDGSQISADTIFMQIKNGKMDNALLKQNAFMVNAVLDTLKFNQLKGRKITAFFANNSIERLFVDGNAENLVFSTNDKTKTITEMFHDRSSRIKITMENNKIIDYVSIRKIDQKIYPFKLVTQEIEVLPGFQWKPEDRPKSVEDMLNRKRAPQSSVPDTEKDDKKDAIESSSPVETKAGEVKKLNPATKKIEEKIQN